MIAPAREPQFPALEAPYFPALQYCPRNSITSAAAARPSKKIQRARETCASGCQAAHPAMISSSSQLEGNENKWVAKARTSNRQKREEASRAIIFSGLWLRPRRETIHRRMAVR